MSHSSNRPHAADGQALLAGHALDDLAREDRFGVIVIPESSFLRDPPRSVESGEIWTDGFDIHLGVYARF